MSVTTMPTTREIKDALTVVFTQRMHDQMPAEEVDTRLDQATQQVLVTLFGPYVSEEDRDVEASVLAIWANSYDAAGGDLSHEAYLGVNYG